MNRLPFENLKDSMQFQQLCAELLQAEGCKNVRGMGTGADQGNDFMFDLPVESPLSNELKPFIAQCKWYGIKNSVNESEVSNSSSYIDTHSATGMLIITSSQFTGTAITKIEATNRSPRNSYQVNHWNGIELTKRLRKYPEIINKFFYSTVNSKVNEQLPEYDEEKFLSDFGLHSLERKLAVDDFPEIPGNEAFVQKMRDFAKEYLANPPKVVLLSGVIGAGKTGYGFDLLNIKDQQGLKIAYLRHGDYKDRYFSYRFNEDDSFLPFLRFCQEVDVLFVDDFGMFMTDKSESLIEMAESYVNLVQERIRNGKLTIVVIPSDTRYGKTIRNYLEYLKRKFPTVWVGDKSIRPYLGWTNDTKSKQKESIANVEKNNAGYILGKDWLIEKYDLIEEDIDQVIKTLLRPEEQDSAFRRRLFEEYGDDESREDEILGELQLVKRRISEYKNYISLLNFHALHFRRDGQIEVLDKK